MDETAAGAEFASLPVQPSAVGQKNHQIIENDTGGGNDREKQRVYGLNIDKKREFPTRKMDTDRPKKPGGSFPKPLGV
jgi:hypothetical protein